MIEDLKPFEFKNELINILDYWSFNMVDKSHGGFYGRIDGENQLQNKADKSVILNSRILWTFSAGFNLIPDGKYRKLADRAFHYILDHFIDRDFGGVYWLLDFNGNPVESKKQIYAQAFAIYGLTEYYKITQEEKALSTSIDIYNLIEKQAFDSSFNGYLEALDRKWNPMEDVRLSEKDLNAQKTMNTHLHILEAYTNLYRVWKDEDLKYKLKGLIDLMINLFVSSDYHFNLFYDKNWKLLSDEFSFGHDIEGSWLLFEAAEIIGEEEVIKKVHKIAIDMVNASLDGMDDDGGLMNEGDENGITDSDKHWWPQAEALVGLINAWQLSGNKKYLEQVSKSWVFIKNNLIDRENGEWFWKISKEGIIDKREDKAGPWKCPYHNGRAMIECYMRLNN
ncbi:AGE family epimerase/isomerase [Mangrovivirga cuniculi]|uniref:Cellobiose 2-epimerase n=1 Tax=Mangrovivirga cuniculi TaxID=2715131 RepID=A0A4D7JFF0_9BACT|nr:AGE family epimerase/isomerase [Mangrovivirga cuniculi]QCK14929.1 N-acyl-D-glucosamine 2-epimerase [Mangrovivirga cuniculi]